MILLMGYFRLFNGIWDSSMLPLHPYQQSALNFSLSKRNSYQALDMGLGKTRIALEWAKQKQGRVLILAPYRTIYTTWPDEIKKWTPGMDHRVLHDYGKTIRPYTKLMIINYQGLDWLYKELYRLFKEKKPMPFTSLVIDEGSMVKSHRTKRFKVLKDLRHLCTEGILILSGTPAPNKLLDLWSQVFLLDGGKRLGTSFNGYRTKYFEPHNSWGAVVIPKSVQEAEKARWYLKKPEYEQEIYDKIKDLMYRLDGSDYLNLPSITYNTITVQLPESVKQQMKVLTSKKVLKVEEEKITVEFAAALSMKLRQMTQGAIYFPKAEEEKIQRYKILHKAKLEVLKSLVEEANGQGILCAIQFKFELDMIRSVFPDAPAIVGGSKDDFTDVLIEWNKGNIPLLICHPASLAYGVNMQAGSHILLWYSLTWSLEHYLQLNKRLHRQGQRFGVIVHHLIAEGTIDEVVLKALIEKQDIQQALLDYLKEETNRREI